MPTTKRGFLIENLRAAIQGLSSVEVAEADSNRAIHTVEPTQLPYVHISQAQGDYIPERSGIGSIEVWDVKLIATVITQDDNIEDIRGDIKEVIALSTTRGGYAEATIYNGDKPYIGADIPSGTQIIEMEITCTYKVEEGKKI